jgi:thymidylate synthase (FAD)
MTVDCTDTCLGTQIKAELISSMGTDDTVADAARVSFDKQASNYTPAQNAKLLHYLAAHNHITPFTHPQITLRETIPIFVARQRFKHVVGFSYNEISRRYVDSPPSFYTPDHWRNRPEGSVKQGSQGVNISSDFYTGRYNIFIEKSKQLYQDMLAAGIAPEQARMALPQSMMTSYYVTGSLAAFARAYKLRIDFHAQKQIQDLAVEWDKIIAPLFPVSWMELTKHTY